MESRAKELSMAGSDWEEADEVEEEGEVAVDFGCGKERALGVDDIEVEVAEGHINHIQISLECVQRKDQGSDTHSSERC